MARRTKRDRTGRIPSDAQLRHRQLSWMMYIAAGAEANLCHALAVNATKLTPEEFLEINRLRNGLLILSRSLRDLERKCK